VILGGLSGSFAPYAFSALAGHYDDEGVIYLRQRVVNVMQSGCRVVSHLREVIETVRKSGSGNISFSVLYGTTLRRVERQNWRG
jgi:hypothetical protein